MTEKLNQAELLLGAFAGRTSVDPCRVEPAQLHRADSTDATNFEQCAIRSRSADSARAPPRTVISIGAPVRTYSTLIARTGPHTARIRLQTPAIGTLIAGTGRQTPKTGARVPAAWRWTCRYSRPGSHTPNIGARRPARTSCRTRAPTPPTGTPIARVQRFVRDDAPSISDSPNARRQPSALRLHASDRQSQRSARRSRASAVRSQPSARRLCDPDCPIPAIGAPFARI